MAWWRAVIVLAVAVAVSTDRPLVQMIRDVIQQRQWNHVVLLDPEDSAAEILSPQEMAQLLRDVVNSAAGSIIPLASNNTVVLGLHRYTATNTLFGSLQKDGHTWNGMVGMLQTDDADVAVAPLSITQIRSLSIDFTIPIQIVSTRLYIRRPVLEGTWTLYGQPFDVYLWVTIPVSILTCATTVEPRPVSGKIVFFSGLWMGLVLLTCYSAILVSILTTRQPQLPFKDFEGLLKNPNWNLGVRTNTALADSLALAPVGSPMRMSWEKMVGKDPIKNLPDNNDDALASVLQVQQAMDIVDTKTDFLRRGIGFGLQKRSPYKNLFNHVLSKMTQKGHLNRLKRKWWPNIDRNPEKDYPAPGFKEVFTVFIILGGGIICALAFLLIEGLVHDYSSSSSSKQSTSPSLY